MSSRGCFRLAWSALLCVAPLGCKSAGDVVVIAPRPALTAAPAPLLAQGGLIAWHAGPKGIVSEWLVAQPDGTLRAQAQRPGAVVAAGDQVFTLATKSREVALYACDDLEQPSGEKATVSTLTATAYPSQRTTTLVEAPTDRAAGLEHEAALGGSLGPYAFVVERLWSFSCGAHGSGGAGQRLVDLRTGEPVVPYDDAAMAGPLAPGRDEAWKKLRDDAFDQEERPSLGMVFPALGRAASAPSIEFDLVWYMSACYACTEGEMGSYTRSHRVRTQVAPAAVGSLDLTALARAAAAVTKSDDTAFGVSEVSASAHAAAAALFGGR